MNYSKQFNNGIEIVKILKTLANSNVEVNDWRELIPLLAQLDEHIDGRARWDLIQTNLLLEKGLWVDIDENKHLVVAQFEPSDYFYKRRYQEHHKLDTWEEMLNGRYSI